jgi:hypothetical protein
MGRRKRRANARQLTLFGFEAPTVKRTLSAEDRKRIEREDRHRAICELAASWKGKSFQNAR